VAPTSGTAAAPAREPSLEPSREMTPPTAQEASAGRLWILWNARRFLWGVLWKTAILSTIVAFLIPTRFTSTAKLVPGETSSSSSMAAILGRVSGAGGSGGSGLSGLGLDPSTLLGLKSPGAFYIEVLKSRTVQDHLIDRFDLRKVYGKKYYKDARKKLGKYTDIEEDKKSNVITLAVTDKSPERARALVKAYVDEMNHLASELNTSAAHREREFLEDRIKTAKQDLDQAAMELSQFSSKNSMVDVQNQGRVMVDAAARVQGELIATESEMKGLQQVYSDDSVRVLTLKARISELQTQLKKLVGNYTDPGATESSPGSANLYPSIRTLPALGYRYSDLYRKTRIQEAVFEFLTQQYELARIQEAKEVPTVRVMDEGDLPEKKSSPIRSLIVGLSMLGAVVLACSWVIGRHDWLQLPADHSRRLLAAEVASESKMLVQRITRNRVRFGA
jgi:uncharacterized protein involved in exopolysaccharide biosynthesis